MTSITDRLKAAIAIADLSVDIQRVADKAADTNDSEDFTRLGQLQEQRRDLVEAYGLAWR